jgi:hypothetical protein
MSGEEIKFTITKTPDGKGGYKKGVKIETSNFVGGACLTAFESLTEYLSSVGITTSVDHQEIKPEMYATTTNEMKNEY